MVLYFNYNKLYWVLSHNYEIKMEKRRDYLRLIVRIDRFIHFEGIIAARYMSTNGLQCFATMCQIFAVWRSYLLVKPITSGRFLSISRQEPKWSSLYWHDLFDFSLRFTRFESSSGKIRNNFQRESCSPSPQEYDAPNQSSQSSKTLTLKKPFNFR